MMGKTNKKIVKLYLDINSNCWWECIQDKLSYYHILIATICDKTFLETVYPNLIELENIRGMLTVIRN